jgi:starch-binding outer membrane protein SusE/F
MKKSIKYLFAAFCLITVFAACKKDESKVFFEGGDKPLLSASSSAAMVLNIANSASKVITFSWTNPNYKFNTGISSQNVTYILQIDTTGANFTNPAIQEVSVVNDLSASMTVKELNTALTKLNLAENIAHNVEFRVKTTISGNAVPLYSNVIKIVITPYLDVAVPVPTTGELYITGDATPSSWTNNPPATQKCIKVSNTEYSIIMNLTSGLYYKFLSTLNQWQPQYGGKIATGGDIGYNLGNGSDPDAIPTPGVSGSYKITLNFKTGKYTVVKQ